MRNTWKACSNGAKELRVNDRERRGCSKQPSRDQVCSPRAYIHLTFVVFKCDFVPTDKFPSEKKMHVSLSPEGSGRNTKNRKQAAQLQTPSLSVARKINIIWEK